MIAVSVAAAEVVGADVAVAVAVVIATARVVGRTGLARAAKAQGLRKGSAIPAQVPVPPAARRLRVTAAAQWAP
jgi:hypothetical protein